MDFKKFVPFKKDKKLGLQWRSKKAAFITISGIIIFIFSPFFISVLNNGNSEYIDKHDAIVQAETYVKDSLKSPKSAKFSGITETHATEISTNEWEVTGWVDAENSFGANIRSNYRVVMEVDAKEREWTKKDIEIQ